MGCAGFLRKCFIRISASGGPAADMGHCLLRITRSFHLLPPAYIILPFFIRFRRWCPKLFYSGLWICRKFLTLRPRGEIEEATTIANVFYFWLLTMQWGVFENSHHYEIWLYKSMETLPSWRRAFFQSSRGRPSAVGWEPAFEAETCERARQCHLGAAGRVLHVLLHTGFCNRQVAQRPLES